MRASVRNNIFGLQTKMKLYDKAMAHVLESFGISKLEMEQKLMIEDPQGI